MATSYVVITKPSDQGCMSQLMNHVQARKDTHGFLDDLQKTHKTARPDTIWLGSWSRLSSNLRKEAMASWSGKKRCQFPGSSPEKKNLHGFTRRPEGDPRSSRKAREECCSINLRVSQKMNALGNLQSCRLSAAHCFRRQLRNRWTTTSKNTL